MGDKEAIVELILSAFQGEIIESEVILKIVSMERLELLSYLNLCITERLINNKEISLEEKREKRDTSIINKEKIRAAVEDPNKYIPPKISERKRFFDDLDTVYNFIAYILGAKEITDEVLKKIVLMENDALLSNIISALSENGLQDEAYNIHYSVVLQINLEQVWGAIDGEPLLSQREIDRHYALLVKDMKKRISKAKKIK